MSVIDEAAGRAAATHNPHAEELDTLQRSDGMFILSDGENGIGCAHPVDLMEAR